MSATLVGIVDAVDEPRAISKAIEAYEMPQHQRARRRNRAMRPVPLRAKASRFFEGYNTIL
jgi:hypothetical protein